MPVFAAGASGQGWDAQRFGDLFGRLGISGPVAQAFLGETQVSRLTGEPVGGRLGMQYQQQESQFARQRASLGIAAAQQALRRQYMTGEGMPGGRGFWQIEDDMTRLSREQQTYGWQMAGRQMALRESQFAQTWGANVEQFQVQASWQQDDFATRAQRMGMSRSWQREDWAVSENVRNMQWGWQQEDFQENIRFATGRDRRRMIREQERATTMHNIEGEQVDKQKERQEELWALEDEAFEKAKARHEQQVEWQNERFELQKQHFEENMELQEEQHEKQMDFMKERWKLEDEMRELQREFQLKQMDLAAAALGLQQKALDEAEKRQAIENILNEIALQTNATILKMLGGSKDLDRAIAIAMRRIKELMGLSWPGAGHQVGFSGLVTKPTVMLAGEGRSSGFAGGGGAGAAEYVSISRLNTGGFPESSDGQTPIKVTVLLDGEEIGAKMTMDRGNNLRVEAFR
jgi:hypothetical protein